MSIRWRIVLSMVLLALVVIGTMGQISLNISKATLNDRAVEFMEAILKRTAYEIAQPVSSAENLVGLLEDDMQVLYDHDKALEDPTYVKRFLERFEGSLKLVAGLGVTKSSFIIMEDGKGGLVDAWVSDANFDGKVDIMPQGDLLKRIPRINELGIERFIVDQEQGSQSLVWVFDPVTKRYLMCMMAIRHEGKVIAILGMDLNYETIRNRLASTTYLKSGYLYLLGRDGNVLYHPKVKPGEAYGDPKSDGTGMFYRAIDPNGAPTLTGMTRLGNGWSLAIEIKESDIFNGLSDIRRAVFIMMGAALVLAIALGMFASNQISKPYVYISHKLDEIGQGNFDVVIDDVHLNRSDEAGLLTRTVDSMRNRQKEMNQNLENKVLERTEELQRTNGLLEEVLAQTVEQQAKLIETEKIASLTYLAVGIAHQMNTPIGNSITSASYLDERLKDMRHLVDTGAIKRSDLYNLLDDGQMGIHSLRQNLETSRMLVDKFKELNAMTGHDRIVPVNLRAFIEDEVALFKEKYPGKPCRFDIEVDPSMQFNCDMKHLEKIFYELLDNSFEHGFEHMDQDQSPQIIIRIVPVHEPNNVERTIRIFYRDNGCGVDEGVLKKIFTPFFTTKLGKKHYGLGLNLLYNLVVGVFRGDISVDENVKGVGYAIILHEQSVEVNV